VLVEVALEASGLDTCAVEVLPPELTVWAEEAWLTLELDPDAMAVRLVVGCAPPVAGVPAAA